MARSERSTRAPDRSVRPIRSPTPIGPSDWPIEPTVPIAPPTALEKFAFGRLEIPRRPFGERSPYAIANLKVTTRGKDALAELREELEIVLGERLSHPAAFEIVMAFAAARRREVAAEAMARRDSAS